MYIKLAFITNAGEFLGRSNLPTSLLCGRAWHEVAKSALRGELCCGYVDGTVPEGTTECFEHLWGSGRGRRVGVGARER